MLCGCFESLKGAHVSDLPLAMSKRCTPAKPLFCDHTLPSTREFHGETMLSWVEERLSSAGGVKWRNASVCGSNTAMEAWYMLLSQSLPSRSLRSARTPVGKSGLEIAMSYSFTAPVAGSSRPIFCSPKEEYQTLPVRSTIAS